MLKPHLLVVVCLLLQLPTLGFAADKELMSQLDWHHDGLLHQEAVKAGFLNRNFPNFNLKKIEDLAAKRPITDVDLGLDGAGSAAWDPTNALIDYAAALQRAHKDPHTNENVWYFADFDAESDFGLKPVEKKASVTPAPDGNREPGSGGVAAKPPVPPGYNMRSPKFTLTRSTSDIVPGVSGSKEAAFLSYAKTTSNGNNQLLVMGIISTDFDFEHAAAPYPVSVGDVGLEEFHLIPSIAFDKATEQQPSSNNVDSLVYRLGLGSLWGTDTGDYQSSFTTNLAYASDFEMRQEVPSVEFNYVPITPNLDMGQFRPLFFVPELAVRTLLTAHLEAGDVVDKGNSKTLKDNTGYLRIGPQLGFTVTPYDNSTTYKLGPLDFHASDITLNVSYLYYRRLLGLEGNAHLFQASLNWAIGGDTSPVSLKLEYDNGVTPLQLQEKHLLSVGLGLKF